MRRGTGTVRCIDSRPFDLHWSTAMLMQVILHTPKWVFAVFFLLLWLGAKQLLANDVGLNRVTLMPVAMGGLSIYGVVSVFGDSFGPMLGWAAAAAVMAAWCCSARCPPPPATTPRSAASTWPAARCPWC
jgi:hypothetical protein